VPWPGRSDDLSRFCKGLVDPYGGRLPICCPTPPRLTAGTTACPGRLSARGARPVAWSGGSGRSCTAGGEAASSTADERGSSHTAKHRPDQDDPYLQEPRWRTPPSNDSVGIQISPGNYEGTAGPAEPPCSTSSKHTCP
jgi:hypothetical protein